MDIKNVRSFFEKNIEFSVLTTYTVDLNQATYNLNQGSINNDIFLHITNNFPPLLVGHIISFTTQDYLVYRNLNEPFSSNHYVYELLPLLVQIELAEITSTSNAIGSSKPVVGTYQLFPAWLNTRAATDPQGSTLQPASVYRQEFGLAFEQLDLTKDYKLKYMGRHYKIKSKSIDNGMVRLFAYEDV